MSPDQESEDRDRNRGKRDEPVSEDVPLGDSLELIFESSDDRLLALPLEAARLDEEILPALHESVTLRRRMLAPDAPLAKSNDPIPGPLKILVAIGAPDEGKTKSHVLDLEAELKNILDSVAGAARHGNAEVKFLEVGHPREIRRALEADAYHVLHLSGHGSPGVMEMEDEEGNPVSVPVEDLVKELRQANRPLPLVFLSFCHGGSSTPDTIGFAQGLIRNGVPMVLSMQTHVQIRLLFQRFQKCFSIQRPVKNLVRNFHTQHEWSAWSVFDYAP